MSRSFSRLRCRIRAAHSDERGAVTIETILLIGAVAVPILIFLLRFGWPTMRKAFVDGVSQVHVEADRAQENQ
jgi:hypothetical protein